MLWPCLTSPWPREALSSWPEVFMLYGWASPCSRMIWIAALGWSARARDRTHSTLLSLTFLSLEKNSVSSSWVEMGRSGPVLPLVADLYCCQRGDKPHSQSQTCRQSARGRCSCRLAAALFPSTWHTLWGCRRGQCTCLRAGGACSRRTRWCWTWWWWFDGWWWVGMDKAWSMCGYIAWRAWAVGGIN